MRQRGRIYTREEDQYIISKIEEDPSNLSRVFRQVGEHLSRDPASIRNRWYHYLAKANCNTSVNTKFMTFGKNQVNINRKISREFTQQPMRLASNSLWERIIAWIVGQ